MKKIMFILSMVTMLPAWLVAQPGVLSIDNDQPAKKVKVHFKKEVPHPVVKLKAEKSFLESHRNAENVRWYDDANGYFVYYDIDGKKGKSFYNRRGNQLYDVLSYPEKFLSGRLREMVKGAYYMDYRITHVAEIRASGNTVHLINITDGKTWKKLRIQDGELELVQDYSIK